MARCISFVVFAITLALVAQVSLAQYAGFSSNSTAWARGELSEDGDSLIIDDLQLRELKGVWQAVSDQYPQSVYEAIEANKMPNCAANDGAYNYARLDATAPQYLVLTGNTTHIFRSNVNLQRSTFSLVDRLNGTLLQARSSAGALTCTHWASFVDVATGEFMAESLTMTQWATNTTSPSAAPVRTSLNCQVVGNEQVGCYSGAVERSATTGVAIASNGAARPAGSIVTVTKQTYVCRNGECLRLSPKWANASPAYGV